MTRWLIWEPTPLAIWATLALLIAAALAVRQYLRAAAPVPLALRLIALALLGLVVWQPSLRYVERADVRRPLRVIVDDSLSMNVTDAARSPGDWLRVATALGTYDASLQPSPLRDLDALRAALDDLREANEALAAARQADTMAAPERARLAASQATVLRAVQTLRASADSVSCLPETLSTLDRLEQAAGDGADAAELSRLLGEAATDVRRQARAADDETAVDDADAAEAVLQTRGLSRFDLAKAAATRVRDSHPAGVALSGLGGALPAQAQAADSPLTAALRDACVRAAADKAEGVVLISDGRATETRSLLASAAAVGVPVYTIAVGPDDRSPDVRVTRVDARPAVLAGQSVVVRVRVSQRNAAGQAARLTLTDGSRSAQRTVQLSNDAVFELTWPDVPAPGVRLTARVDGLAGESQTANNTQSTFVVGVPRRERVLLLAGPAGRDVEELAAALGEASWVELNRPHFDRDQPAPIGRPDEVFARADLIILSDLSAASLDDTAWAALTRAVRSGGRSLVVLAGEGDWLADPDIARRLGPLLPVTPGPPPTWVNEPVWTVPTRFGVEAAFLRLDETADASQRAWLGRPKLGRLLAVGPVTASGRALLADRSTQAPVLLDAPAGGGRVTMVLTDEIWRWTETDPDAARRFWAGLADTLDDLPYTTQNDGLSIAIDRTDVTAGRTVYARARVADPAAGAVSMTVTAGGVSLPPPPLRELLPGGGRLVAPLNLPAGSYEVTLRQGGRSVKTTLQVAADAQQELADTAADIGFLHRIADATGGGALTLEDIGRLPELLARHREENRRVSLYPVWSSPYAFAMIVACLGLEWALRPRVRLP